MSFWQVALFFGGGFDFFFARNCVASDVSNLAALGYPGAARADRWRIVYV
jgi:hypothetical protein